MTKFRIVSIIFFYLLINQHPIQSLNFQLLIPLYDEQNDARINEYIECLNKNLKNKFIDKIHIFYDTTEKTKEKKLLKYLLNKKDDKILIRYTDGRLSYRYCFEYVNKECYGKKIIISNADIYFDDSLRLLEKFNFNNIILALCRWEISKKSIKPGGYQRLQDSWIFSSPIKVFIPNEIKIGTPSCDNYFVLYAKKNNFLVIDPSLDIKNYHLHLSNVRNYLKDPQMPHVPNIGYVKLKSTKLPSNKEINKLLYQNSKIKKR